MIDRKLFFTRIRSAPFPGRLTETQVSGCEAILAEYEKRQIVDLRWPAYMLATTYHETAFTMQPIYERGPREYFDKYDAGTAIGAVLGNIAKGDGYLYRGRGYVQLTGRANYSKMSQILGIDLIGNPDLALKPGIAAAIMFEGMARGTFTGKKLSHYFTDASTDWVGARRIINGLDKADTIAGYARKFHDAILAAVSVQPEIAVAPKPPAPMPQPIPDVPKLEPKPVPEKGFWGKFADLFRPKGTS